MTENVLLDTDELMWFFEQEPEKNEDESCVIFKLNDGVNDFEIAFGYALPFLSIRISSSIGVIYSSYFEQIIKISMLNDETGDLMKIELRQNNDISYFEIRVKPQIQINLQSLMS